MTVASSACTSMATNQRWELALHTWSVLQLWVCVYIVSAVAYMLWLMFSRVLMHTRPEVHSHARWWTDAVGTSDMGRLWMSTYC